MSAEHEFAAGLVQLSARDWIHVALDVITQEGMKAVAVEPLARRLGVTKGSFYWHFSNRAALIEAALAHWEQTGTEEIIELLERVGDPRERLRHLIVEAIEDRAGGRLSAALGLPQDQARRWALHAYSTYMGLHYLLRTRACRHGTRGLRSTIPGRAPPPA